jgi:hypothetical protein
MIAMGLTMWRRGHIQSINQILLTKFHKNPPVGSKVIASTKTDRQDGDLTSLLLFLNESYYIIKPALAMVIPFLDYETQSSLYNTESKYCSVGNI